MEYTMEKSKEEAAKLKSIQETLMTLDEEYLESALKDMRENHDMRDSMAILNPNPFSHNEQQDLNEAKLEQINLILKLKNNMLTIATCQGKLMRAKGHENEMKNMFGG
jgi:hypothetical protein